jgi:hypothetical protein
MKEKKTEGVGEVEGQEIVQFEFPHTKTHIIKPNFTAHT